MKRRPGIGQLLVSREARFHQARIIGVQQRDDAIEIDFVAESAEWFNPDSFSADPDGWVREVTDVVGSGAIGTTNAAMMARWLDALERWRDAGDEISIEADFEQQTISHYNPRLDEMVTVRMNPAELDRT